MKMKFRTEVNPLVFKDKINYQHKIMFVGSCFTTNIGERMQRLKFNVDVNPFGVVYNPASIANSLKLLLDKKQFKADDLCCENGVWFSYSHHSSFSSINQHECLQAINGRLLQSAQFLQQADFLFITLGTAYAYQLKESGEIVSNCHKTPAKYFDRQLLSVSSIVDGLSEMFEQLWANNPQLKIIFSVSPIRHLKDGAHGNQLSKSALLLAVDELVQKYNGQCNYFEAYELLLDDLRDYRFYDTDMCHPSLQAVDYIWQKFMHAAIDEDAHRLIDDINAIVGASLHRPFNRDGEQYIAFKKKYINQIEDLQTKFPHLDFSTELAKF